MWSTKKLTEQAEKILNEKTKEGYELVSMSFGYNPWWIPTIFITFSK
jgi:hypothetical protein